MKKFYLLAVAALFLAASTSAQRALPLRQTVSEQHSRQHVRSQQKAVRADAAKHLASAKAPRKAEGLTAQPEGTAYDLLAAYSGLYYNWYYGWQDGSTDNGRLQLVEGTDGNIYIKGLTPNAGLDEYYWVKAVKGEGDTIVIAQQPTGYYEDYLGDIHTYDIARISYSYDDATEEEDISLADAPAIKLLYKGNGVLQTPQEMNASGTDIPPFIYGPVFWYEAEDDDDYPSGFYTNDEYYWNLSTRVNTETYAEPQAGTAIEEMILNYENDGEKKSKLISVAFEGSDVVLLKLYERVPGWVKGTIKGDKVVIENGQYLGYDSYYETFEWAHTATVETLYDEKYDEYYDQGTITSRLVLDYDATTRTISTTEGAIFIDGKKDAIYYAEYYSNPTIKYFVEVAAVPADPTISYWWDLDLENGYWAELDFKISNTEADGDFIQPDKLSYVIYVDGDIFEATADDEYGVDEPLSEFPYGFRDSEGWIGTTFFCFPFQPAETVGIQAIYRGAGVEQRSSIVEYDIATGETTKKPYDNTATGVRGIDNAGGDAAVVTYDIAGRRVQTGTHGLLLQSRRTADGTRHVVKVIR